MDIQEHYLQSHRFQISEQSMSLLKTLRNELPVVNKEFKVIEGLGFFGSRTKGLEKENDQNQPEKLESDVDLCVFYDGSLFGYDNSSLTFHQSNLNRARHQFEAQLQDKFKERIKSYFNNKIDQEGESIFVVDISKDATLRALDEFYKSVSLNETQNSEENHKLLARFFLGVGEELYKNRKFILDQFKKREDGDRLIQILMQRLGKFERTPDYIPNKSNRQIVPFEGYPKTIEEAENFFLTKQY